MTIRRVKSFLNNRPLCVIGMLSGLKDILVGTGFLFQFNQVTRTHLFQNFNELIPGYSGWIVGIFFILSGIVVITGESINKMKLARWGLRYQAYAWLFSGIMYTLDQEWILALILGGFFSVVSGYTAYYYKYKTRS